MISRVFVPGGGGARGQGILYGREARHIRRMLRLGQGEKTEVVGGTGREYGDSRACRKLPHSL